MIDEDFGWNIDEPLEDDEGIPSKWELRRLFPGLTPQDAEEITYFAHQIGGEYPEEKRLVNQAIRIIQGEMWTWRQLRWRWVIDALARLVAKSKERYQAVVKLNERLDILDQQVMILQDRLERYYDASQLPHDDGTSGISPQSPKTNGNQGS